MNNLVSWYTLLKYFYMQYLVLLQRGVDAMCGYIMSWVSPVMLLSTHDLDDLSCSRI